MDTPHNKSYKADRTDMYEDPQTYTQFITDVAKANITKMDRALIALGLITSGRITELIKCKAGKIKLFDHNNTEIPNTDFYKSLKPSDISRLEVTLMNEKNKKTRIKTIPCINVDIYETPIKWLLERLQELPDPIYEDSIYGKSRTQAWYLMKSINSNWFPHLLRHLGTSQDVRMALPPSIIQKKNGWKNADMLSRYTHLQTSDITDALKRAYGEKPKPIPIAKSLPPIKEVTPAKAWVPPIFRPGSSLDPNRVYIHRPNPYAFMTKDEKAAKIAAEQRKKELAELVAVV